MTKILLMSLIFLAGCNLQVGEPERGSDGLILSDRWEHLSKEFDGTEQDCLNEVTKDFWLACPQIYSGSTCNNMWDYTEAYTFISDEDGLKYCGMSLPRDYHLELL